MPLPWFFPRSLPQDSPERVPRQRVIACAWKRIMKRSRHSQDYQIDDDEEWTVEGSSPSPRSSNSSPTNSQFTTSSRLRRANRDAVSRTASYISRHQSANANAPPLTQAGIKKTMTPQPNCEKNGGLPLPDVVRELLKEKSVLRYGRFPSSLPDVS